MKRPNFEVGDRRVAAPTGIVGAALKASPLRNLLLGFFLLLGMMAGLVPQSAQASPYTEGTKRVLVIRTFFSNQDQPDTNGIRRSGPIPDAAFFKQMADQVSFFYNDQSFQKTQLITTVVSVTLTGVKDTDWQGKQPLPDFRELVRARVSTSPYNIDLEQYDLDVIAMSIRPDNGASGTSYIRYPQWEFAGLAYVGQPGQLLNGYQGGFDKSVMAHETGHNYGSHHANLWVPFFESTTIGQGQTKIYGNPFDVMGNETSSVIPDAHFTASVKNRMGWLPTSRGILQLDQDSSSNGVHIIEAIDDVTNRDFAVPLTIKIKRTNRYNQRSGDNYWVEFRDAWFKDQKYVNDAAVVTWNYNRYSANTSTDLIDATPETKTVQNGIIETVFGAAFDAPLAVGRTLSDLDAVPDIHITPLRKVSGAAGTSTMEVLVNIGTYGDNRDPSVSIIAPAPVDANAHPKEAATPFLAASAIAFTAVGTDPDTADTNLQYYWDFGDRNNSNDGKPTQTHTYASDGEYQVHVRVSDGKGGENVDSIIVKVGAVTTYRVSGRVMQRNAETNQFDPVVDGIVRASNYNYYFSYNPNTGTFSDLEDQRFGYTDSQGYYTIVGLIGDPPQGQQGRNIYELNAGKNNFIFVPQPNWSNPITVTSTNAQTDTSGNKYIKDDGGNIKRHNFDAITSDLVDPRITLDTPEDGSTVSSLTSITGKANDNAGGAGLRSVEVTLQRASDGKFWNPTTGKWETVVDPNPNSFDGSTPGERIERVAPKLTTELDSPDPQPSKGKTIGFIVPNDQLPPTDQLSSDDYTVTATARDEAGNNSSAGSAITVNNTVVPPGDDDDDDDDVPPPTGNGTSAIDLNGPTQGGVSRTVAWNKNASTTVLADPTATVTNTAGTVAKIEVSIANRQNGASETLAATAATGVTVDYNPSTGILTLQGPAAPSVFETVVRSVTYANAASSPTGTSRSIRFRVFGGTNNAFATVTLTTGPVTPGPGDDDDDDDDDDNQPPTNPGNNDSNGNGIPDDQDNDNPKGGTGGDSQGSFGGANSRIDLNGNGAGYNYTTKWEKDGATNLADSDSTIKGKDMVQKLVVSIQGGTKDNGESMSATAGGGITSVYSNGVLTLQGPASRQAFETVLRSVQYSNNSTKIVVGDDGKATGVKNTKPTGTTRKFRFDLYGDINSTNSLTSSATTTIDMKADDNLNNNMFTGTSSVSGDMATIIYRVRNTSGQPMNGINIKGKLSGGRPYSEAAEFNASVGVVFAKFVTPDAVKRLLRPDFGGKNVVWRIDSLAVNQEAVLTIKVPLLKANMGDKLTDRWTASFPDGMSETVNSLMAN